MAASQVFQLEAFESSIRGKKVRWFRTPSQAISWPVGFQEQCLTETPPYQRKILISSHGSSEAWKMLDRWDAILMPQTSTDWSLVLTVLLNQLGPCIVLITPEVKIPFVFFQKCIGSKAPTFIHVQNLVSPLPAPTVTYDATFLPPFSQEDAQLDAIQTVLTQNLPAEIFRNFVLKDACRDLRSAGATLVISSIDEASPNLYWYYATDGKSKQYSLIAQVLETLALRPT